MDYSKDSIHAPLWVVGFGGAAFVGGGFWLFIHGARGLRRIWNMEHGKQQLPTSPWLWDYPWQAWGTRDNYLESALTSLIAFIVLGVLLAPFNWIAFIRDDSSFFWQGVVGLLDLIIIVGVGSQFTTNLNRYLRFGNAKLCFNNFPFFLGKPMSLTLKYLPTDIPTTLQLDLRCIEEAYEVHGEGENKKSVVECYQIYKDSKVLEKKHIEPGADLHLSWVLPNDKSFSSTPSERPATFWELEVTAERPDINYRSRFILPIYTGNK